ncbi:MAG: hypothetical protein ACJ8GN_06305 [Longimicrobiaceae bacterium]
MAPIRFISGQLCTTVRTMVQNPRTEAFRKNAPMPSSEMTARSFA